MFSPFQSLKHFICFFLSCLSFSLLLVSAIILHIDTMLSVFILVSLPCLTVVNTSDHPAPPLSIYQHAGCLASWCLRGWRGRLGKPGCHSSGRWGSPSGAVMPTGTGGTVGTVSRPRVEEGTGWREGGVLSRVCTPTLTNWMRPPVDRKGSASVRLTYEEDWHSGWSGHGAGGVRVAENRCVCHHCRGIMLTERKHYLR